MAHNNDYFLNDFILSINKFMRQIMHIININSSIFPSCWLDNYWLFSFSTKQFTFVLALKNWSPTRFTELAYCCQLWGASHYRIICRAFSSKIQTISLVDIFLGWTRRERLNSTLYLGHKKRVIEKRSRSFMTNFMKKGPFVLGSRFKSSSIACCATWERFFGASTSALVKHRILQLWF